jgi:hypothetical protein
MTKSVLRIVAALILAAAATVSPVRAESITPTCEVIETVPTTDCGTLRSVLDNGGDLIAAPPAGAEGLQLSKYPRVSARDDFPQIVLNFTAGVDENGKNNLSFSAGAVVLLNNSGFFITARHCLPEPNEKGNNFVVYGPRGKFLATGRLLAVSTDSDLALGRIFLPPGTPAGDLVKITKGNLKPGDLLFTKRYNAEFVGETLPVRLIKTVKKPAPGAMIDTKEELNLGLEYELTSGRTITANLADGQVISGPKPGVYFMATGTTETLEGHSGSPVFDLNGDLAGLILEVPKKQGLLKNAEGEAMQMAYIAGPEKIRELIEAYLAACED